MCQNCKGTYYTITAIAYASNKSHIGNTYEIILVGSIARYKREQGYDVFFQAGTDEHEQKTEEGVGTSGVTPKGFVDKAAAEIRRIRDLMNVSYDRFTCTTDQDREAQVQKIFKKLYDQDDIYKGYHEGLHCTSCKPLLTESQLVDGKCLGRGCEVKLVKEETYFFHMNKHAPRLIKYINGRPEFIQPVSRKNKIMNNFLLPGLQDLCVSRTTFSWSIPVDSDPRHVTHVWLDVLTNCITGIGYDRDGSSTDQFKKYQPVDLHLIGEDIIRFHTIYWLILLMALDLPLPKQAFGYPWLLQDDGKMSKSEGNVFYTDTLVNFFGVDVVRYFMLHKMPFNNDGVTSWELMVERVNSSLVSMLGNLVNHTISMSNRYFDGVVSDKSAHGEAGENFKKVVLEEMRKTDAKMGQLRVADAITEILNIFRKYSEYINKTTPWASAKDGSQKNRLATVFYNLTEAITIRVSLLYSSMPETPGEILAQVHAGKRELFRMDTLGLYPNGQRVMDKPEILFARMDTKEVLEKTEAMHGTETAADQNQAGDEEGASGSAEDNGIDLEAKAEITYDDFAKLQFRVGEVIKCETVPKSKKFLCFQVKTGSQVRQISSGVKAYYSPEGTVGKKVMVVTNLKPAKLAGMVLEGMILCAEDAEGSLALVTPEKSVPAGAEIC